MTEIRFYHLQKQSPDQALPAILGKAYEAGYKSLVKLATKADCTHLNNHLWTYHPQSFLPHDTEASAQAAAQPILLSSSGANHNKATMILVADGSQPDGLDDFTLCCDMFNGQHPESVEKARERWKAYKEAGHTISYWIQDETGKWSQKA